MIINVFDAADPKKIVSATLVNDGENIILGGLCNGVRQMVVDIADLATRRKAKISLLRIFSHGQSGLQNISAGTNAYTNERSSLNLKEFDSIKSDLMILNEYFDNAALVELHGCSVGAGENGDKLLQSLSDLWRVKVKAGVFLQYSGTTENQTRFEGPTKLSYPDGGRPLQTQTSQVFHYLREGEFSNAWKCLW